MRINLVTPFADKDAAKALGARWDVTKKCWYIVDVADLTPFMRWIPDMDSAMGSQTDVMKPSAKSTPSVKVDQFTGVTTGAAVEVPNCGCDVLPWEDCVHTAKATVS